MAGWCRKAGYWSPERTVSLLSDKIKDRNELEIEMIKKNLRDLGERTERSKKWREGNAGEEETEKFVV